MDVRSSRSDSSRSDDNKTAPNTHSNPSKMIISTLELRLRIVFHSRLVGGQSWAAYGVIFDSL
jgi:hypothetical protein